MNLERRLSKHSTPQTNLVTLFNLLQILIDNSYAADRQIAHTWWWLPRDVVSPEVHSLAR
jgi:hypothetical protein